MYCVSQEKRQLRRCYQLTQYVPVCSVRTLGCLHTLKVAAILIANFHLVYVHFKRKYLHTYRTAPYVCTMYLLNIKAINAVCMLNVTLCTSC